MKHDKSPSSLKEVAYGGVVINNQGKILLREPKNHFDGYVWTFPKGRRDKKHKTEETPEETALREVSEETGIKAEIKGRLPGVYAGGTTDNVYYVMRFVEDRGKFDKETQSIRWATPEEARDLISLTTNPIGRQRDLKVLQEALELI